MSRDFMLKLSDPFIEGPAFNPLNYVWLGEGVLELSGA